MLNLYSELRKTITILSQENTSLYAIARKTGIDPFSFYVGADLRGIELSDKDVRGLSFSRADLQGVDLSDIKFDIGAFNESIIDKRFNSLKDEFDVSVTDLDEISKATKWLNFYVRFRKSSLERAIAEANMRYQDFADSSNISTATLLSARRGYSVSKDTAAGICRTIIQRLADQERVPVLRYDFRSSDWYLQPIMRIIGGYGSHPTPMTKQEFLQNIQEVNEMMNSVVVLPVPSK